MSKGSRRRKENTARVTANLERVKPSPVCPQCQSTQHVIALDNGGRGCNKCLVIVPIHESPELLSPEAGNE